MEDHYKVLGVPYNASPQDISRAYRKQALRVHPDKNLAEDATAKFQALKESYDILKDPKTREVYDSLLQASGPSGPPPSTPSRPRPPPPPVPPQATPFRPAPSTPSRSRAHSNAPAGPQFRAASNTPPIPPQPTPFRPAPSTPSRSRAASNAQTGPRFRAASIPNRFGSGPSTPSMPIRFVSASYPSMQKSQSPTKSSPATPRRPSPTKAPIEDRVTRLANFIRQERETQSKFLYIHKERLARWSNTIMNLLAKWQDGVRDINGKHFCLFFKEISVRFEAEDSAGRKEAIHNILQMLGNGEAQEMHPDPISYRTIPQYQHSMGNWHQIYMVMAPASLYVFPPTEMDKLCQRACLTIYAHSFPSGGKQIFDSEGRVMCKRCGGFGQRAWECYVCELRFCGKCATEVRMLKAYEQWLNRPEPRGPLDNLLLVQF